MSKLRGDPSCGISSGEVLMPPERHPACRQHEARAGSGTERENLDGDAKGKGASGYHREAESTDASARGGLPRSSDEAAVTAAERRGWVIAADLAQRVRPEEPFVQSRAAALMQRHVQVRICGGLEVKFPWPTWQKGWFAASPVLLLCPRSRAGNMRML
jgi:hypothetical protein